MPVTVSLLHPLLQLNARFSFNNDGAAIKMVVWQNNPVSNRLVSKHVSNESRLPGIGYQVGFHGKGPRRWHGYVMLIAFFVFVQL
jgi:hypothetical protein